ncbi:PRKC apoptosis WT1 regulator protein isoform X2 [Lingula anatina]|uniref:PRKC apoptosis WT1 regulator protein isoform X2 n=1 Tax=Lingula anatina TaxID=7574 RepID=A0A1S3K351_LINAN|nr:PRKC apoptosis WT1 regulator protein isoform X2 [Lingula anatina]|eukprot:XP_013417058.1 PRKC apoptosis WT1 regulator protein isoform X2 [Lingula anatina]
MASSSLSQESLDRDDYEINCRRSKLKPTRGRSGGYKAGPESADNTGDGLDKNGDGHCPVLPDRSPNRGGDHESPSRLGTPSRSKDSSKRRPNHLHKGKTAKDKRKLREKRRSTGVVHLPSESTGDSLDEEDAGVETKKNTSYNEVIDNDNPETPVENRLSKSFASRCRNKSPSDLEADLEDNQDYDSTVSQSETNLTIIGQSAASTSQSTYAKHSPEKELSRIQKTEEARTTFNNQDRDRGHASTVGGRVSLSAFNRFDRDSSGFAKLSYKTNLIDIDSSHSRPSLRPSQQELKLQEKNKELEKQLAKEKEENQRLKELLEGRDRQIARLEREIALLNQKKQ